MEPKAITLASNCLASLWRPDNMITVKCSKHPKYKAIHEPRSKCIECHWLYWIANTLPERAQLDMKIGR